MGLPRVVLRQVTKRYQSDVETVLAADAVDLQGHAGEFVCIAGASGSGKSTLLNIVAGLLDADEGEVTVNGVDVVRADPAERARLRLRDVGVVWQAHNLIEEFTALENVALPLEAAGASWADASAQARDQLDRVGLGRLGARLPSQLSGGQRQRVGIARALVGDKTVLLADEPTGALDATATTGIFLLLRQLCDEGLLALVCSHDTGCATFADASYRMLDGRLTPQAAAPVRPR